MTIISPSLLACDFLNIEKELSYFKDIPNLWLHLDIMDGHFVPNLTFGHPIISKIEKITSIPLDAHLMVSNPLCYIESLKNMNIFNFTFHIEATEVPLQIINEAKKYFPSVGISIKPKTDVNLLTPEILKLIDLVLVMSVEPGFGGQSFIESSIEKVSYFSQKKKEKNFHYQIQVDGGVSSLNSKILIDAGADNLVAGSYIFKKGPDQYLSKISSLLPTH